MKCSDCKLVCAAKSEPQEVAMDGACKALVLYCQEGRPPENPMSWLRGYIERDLRKPREEFTCLGDFYDRNRKIDFNIQGA